MAKPTTMPPTPAPGSGSTMGNKGGAVRGQARAAQVKARNAARRTSMTGVYGQAADPTKGTRTDQ